MQGFQYTFKIKNVSDYSYVSTPNVIKVLTGNVIKVRIITITLGGAAATPNVMIITLRVGVAHTKKISTERGSLM
jgi:hypothetical protein